MASAAIAGVAAKAQLGFTNSTFSGQSLKASSSAVAPAIRAKAGIRAAGYDEELKKTAKTIATKGRGILAMDESNATAGLRLASIGVENTEENRRQYRELLTTAPGLGQYVSGAILFEETLYQSTADGRKFVDVLNKENIVPGIKVDKVSSQISSLKLICVEMIMQCATLKVAQCSYKLAGAMCANVPKKDLSRSIHERTRFAAREGMWSDLGSLSIDHAYSANKEGFCVVPNATSNKRSADSIRCGCGVWRFRQWSVPKNTHVHGTCSGVHASGVVLGRGLTTITDQAASLNLQGLVPLAGSNDESWCQGLDGLASRTAAYYKAGARFAKW